ncbi:MAG: phosphoribosylamine--glycine ligase [Hyphomicrobiales bacterium]|nr:phosphoribosylamine--glycine ligase [Hyphomicrobiales bacterium]MDE2016129.1 phosphoribosylamine--glycine ligase [Hyphomicrobiales bacterium]
MNLLLIGSGGREHALAMHLARSPTVERLYAAPGNSGTAAVAENVALDAADHAAVIAFCARARIGLVVVGPETPLVAGLVDALAAAGVPAFGPTAAAARLEGSKAFAKEFCAEFGIPTAAFSVFDDEAAALAHLAAGIGPIVVKADGLAAGKGVVVARTREEAADAVRAMFAGTFGAAGARVVLEETLMGEEASFFALCDGERAAALGGAQDHKRVGEGDTGPNTGGMGAYSPAPALTPTLQERVMREIVHPTVAGMKARGAPFRGVLFVGLMLTAEGPEVIEFNVRFGDPETQALMPRLAEDLLPWLIACAEGRLPEGAPRMKSSAALTVVVAARGYPEAPKKGGAIRGLESAASIEGVEIVHAGAKVENGAILADGGRVLCVTGTGATLREARDRAYAGVAAIDYPDGFHRRDIGWRALK